MQVQIKPAVYGDNGLRFEAYEVINKFSWWKGNKLTYEQLYWKKTEEGFTPTDRLGWIYDKEDKNKKCWRSGKTIGEVVKIMKECYGNSVEFTIWRPE